MEDRTSKILEILNLFLIDSQQSKDQAAPFKVRAYTSAIKSIKEYGRPIVSKEDVDYLYKNKMIGKKIRDKLYEIILTGDLEEVKPLREAYKNFETIREQLLKIHGIGPVKAEELIKDYNIRTLDDLREIVLENPEFLTEAQTLSLAFYSDLIQRIPRLEMMEHEKYIREFIQSRYPEFTITIVGSYRRGESSSGDIDILLSYHNMEYNEAQFKYKGIIEELMMDNYCIGTLSNGRTKYMGLVQIDENSLVRRLDILLTKPEEFTLSLLYFTGSQKFNIAFRRLANSKGYTLNEHFLSKLDWDIKSVFPKDRENPPIFHTEKDVFDFLRVKYLSPQERTGEIEVY